jgi:hypothetical protein
LSVKGKAANTRQDTRSSAELEKQLAFRPAQDLCVGDYVFLPTKGKINTVDWFSFLPKTKSKTSKEVVFNPSDILMGRLLGYYAAEGHTSWINAKPYSVTWSFSREERDYIDDVANLVKAIFGLNAAIYVGRPNKAVTQICVHSTVVAQFITALVPGKVRSTTHTERYTLQFNSILMTAPVNVQREILIGWLRGDGNCTCSSGGKVKLTGTGAAKTLVLQLYRMAQRVGLRPSWKIRGNSADVYFSIAEDVEKLEFAVGERKRTSCAQRRFVSDYVAVRIKEIVDLDYCADVYNLDVNGDDLLCVDGLISHNCDPPYVPASETAKFTSYGPHDFVMEDHRRLAKAVRDLDASGVRFLLSNSDTGLVRELYAGFEIETVSARRAINCAGEKRGPVGEVLVRNY